MRYKAATKDPAYLGGVEEFDIYVTPSMNVVARWGNVAKATACHITNARDAATWMDPLVPHMTPEIAERIAVMVRCFGPE